MSDSILTSTKKVLGIMEDYTAFDPDILLHINTIFSVLNQLGVGPADGFMIEDATPVWSDFYGSDTGYNMIKTYVYLRVRMLFDPPTTSFLQDALSNQVNQLEWRINVKREVDLAATPTLPDPWDPTQVPPTIVRYYNPWDNTDDLIVLDGGSSS